VREAVVVLGRRRRRGRRAKGRKSRRRLGGGLAMLVKSGVGLCTGPVVVLCVGLGVEVSA